MEKLLFLLETIACMIRHTVKTVKNFLHINDTMIDKYNCYELTV